MRKLSLPSCAEGIEVWRLDLNLASPLIDADWATLNEDEKLRATKFFRHEDRVRHVAVRGALRRLLGDRLEMQPEQLIFETNRYGKPRLHVDAGIEFNVSHSGSFALIAISSKGAVGVDIEQYNPNLDVAGLVDQVLSSNERVTAIGAHEFFELWVLKESALKALGLGISENLQGLSIGAASNAGEYTMHLPNAEGGAIHACKLDAPEGYRAALAWLVAPTQKKSSLLH